MPRSTKHKISALKSHYSFSKFQLAIFVIAFGLIGISLYISLAVTMDPVIGAAGDIACDPYTRSTTDGSITGTNPNFNNGQGTANNCNELATSNLLSNVNYVLPLGDTQYECGDTASFQQSYDPSWGRFITKTYPTIGNHEYGTSCGRSDPTQYFSYFKNGNGNGGTPIDPAGPSGKGWYSYDISIPNSTSKWHMIALDSECSYGGSGAYKVGGCQAGSPQETWLKNDLATNATACILAYWHEPRFSSGQHGDAQQMVDIWNDLVAAHADVVLNGHNHDYERFDTIGNTPVDPEYTSTSTVTGTPSYQNPNMSPIGIREFVVGTGGKNHYGFTDHAVFGTNGMLTGEVFRNSTDYGILEMTLHANSYDWQFINKSNVVLDQGTSSCDNTTPPTDTTAPTVSLTSPGNSTTLSGSNVIVSANASDNVAVAGVHFQIHSATNAIAPATQNIGDEVLSAPYKTTMDTTKLPNGIYTITATVRDTSGNSTVSTAVNITVDNTTSGSLPNPTSTNPLRGMFYYSWFPENWHYDSSGNYIDHVHSTLGAYDSSSQSVIDSHIQQIDYAGMNLGIISWWGINQHKENIRVPLILQETRALKSNLKWALYYEKEGSSDPSVTDLETDLDYIKANYANDPSYAKINGKPVIFVYNDGDTDCTNSALSRWITANDDEGFYIDLKVFSGYQTCHDQPDAWHQYAPVNAEDNQPNYSFAISPGFWKYEVDATNPCQSVNPCLTRDVSRWQQNIQDMIASKDPWQLVTTFNEMGEGTAVESATEWPSASGEGLYLDALHDALVASQPDTQPPIVNLTGPTAGSNLRGSVNLTATATDNVGVATVKFMVDGNLVGQTSSQPYSAPWDSTTVTDGQHTIMAQAFDAAGNASALSSVTINVDNSSPAIAITAPLNGATVAGNSVNISATATDNTGVAGVQFMMDGNNQGTEDTSSPYSTVWDTTTLANGSHTLTAVARDAAGNTTTSAPITVTVNNQSSPDTTPPSVPTGLASTGATTTTIGLIWNASTDSGANASGVAGYKIYRNGSFVQEVASGLNYTDSGLMVNTTYVYAVSAIDNAGNESAKSGSIKVTTNANPPTINLSAAPPTITAGSSSTLNWSSSNATSCTASGGWSGSKATSGTQSVSPTITSTYSLTCTGTGGSANASTVVTVNSGAPSVSLSASPSSITAGSSSTLNWSSSNATSCTASGGWSGVLGTSGSQTVSPTATTTYTLTCAGGGGSTVINTTLTVTAPPPSGDVNGDGHVDIFDLSILLSHYGKTTSTGDVNHDGQVNLIDLSILLSHFGK